MDRRGYPQCQRRCHGRAAAADVDSFSLQSLSYVYGTSNGRRWNACRQMCKLELVGSCPVCRVPYVVVGGVIVELVGATGIFRPGHPTAYRSSAAAVELRSDVDERCGAVREILVR